MRQSLHELLRASVDYAGLFPPAALSMAEAVRQYAAHLGDPDSFMLGRFVVPVARLREFETAALEPCLVASAGTPAWKLSALVGVDVEADVRLVHAFNDRHADSGGPVAARIDALELRAGSEAEIAAATSRIPHELTTFFEIPAAADPAPLVAEIRRSGGMAKLRTGGVTADAFPAAESVVRFMLCCRDEGVGFKLTAGLHHPLRGSYRLTYEEGAPTAEMFGFLNMLTGAVLAWAGADESTVLAAVREDSVGQFHFADQALSFRGVTVPDAAIREARSRFVISFGSCSFAEPVAEIADIFLAE